MRPRGLGQGQAALVLIAAWLVLGPACTKHRGRTRDPTALALYNCEQVLLRLPPGAEGLDRHLQCLLNADVALPRRGRIHARLARALTLRAQLDPVEGRQDLATARSWALRCLLLNESVAGRMAGSDGRLGRRALRAVGAEDTDCLTWGGLAWSRWLWARGVVGASIDLEIIDGLSSRALELQPELDQGRPWQTEAVAAAIVPAVLDPQPGRAARAFDQARALAPDRLMVLVDQAEYLHGPAGDEAAWRRELEQVLELQPSVLGYAAYENEAARIRAQALLDAGMPEPSRW